MYGACTERVRSTLCALIPGAIPILSCCICAKQRCASASSPARRDGGFPTRKPVGGPAGASANHPIRPKAASVGWRLPGLAIVPCDSPYPSPRSSVAAGNAAASPASSLHTLLLLDGQVLRSSLATGPASGQHRRQHRRLCRPQRRTGTGRLHAAAGE